MASEVGKEDSQCRMYYKQVPMVGNPTGDLWEAAENTDLSIVQLKGEKAGVFIHHLLPAMVEGHSWKSFFPGISSLTV